MSKLKQWIIMLGVILAVGVGAFFLGNFNANVGRGQLLNESHMEQQLAKQEYGNDMKIKNVVKNIEQQSSIILVEETGIANVELNKSDAKWNSWLTSSSFSYSAEYKAVLGIDSDNLTFVQDGDKLLIIANNDSFYVQALEVTNKNVVLNRALFGNAWTENEKIAVEKELVSGVKDKLMDKKDTQIALRDGLEAYLYGICNNFGLQNVEIIIQ